PSHAGLAHPKPRRAARCSPVILIGLVRANAAALLVVTGLAVHWLYLSGTVTLGWPYIVALLGMAASASLTFQAVGAYSSGALTSFIGTGMKMACAWTFVFLGALACVFFL